MKSISNLLVFLCLTLTLAGPAKGSSGRLSEFEVKALLATSPVFEERDEQTVRYTLHSDGRVSALARWLLWSFTATGSWRINGEIVCIFLEPEDE